MNWSSYDFLDWVVRRLNDAGAYRSDTTHCSIYFEDGRISGGDDSYSDAIIKALIKDHLVRKEYDWIAEGECNVYHETDTERCIQVLHELEYFVWDESHSNIYSTASEALSVLVKKRLVCVKDIGWKFRD